jgi:DedD protein
MSTRLRNRIVGATVLASLAVIFIPMILTGEGDLDLKPRGPAIPPEPEMSGTNLLPTLPADPAPPIENAQPVVVERHTPEPDDPSSEPAPTAPAEPGAVPGDVAVEQTQPPQEPTTRVPAWAVQVGSFSVRNRAFALRDQLRGKGYAAYVETVQSGTAPVYRVRVGPELEQDLAQRLRERIAKDTGQQGLVVKHNQ